MKKVPQYFLLFIFAGLLMSLQCKKSNDPFSNNTTPSTPVLPNETTSGANTFGCLVNNNVWLPNSGMTHFYADYSNKVFYIGASYANPNDITDSGSHVSIRGNFINSIGTYNLRKLSADSDSVIGHNVYYCKNTKFYWIIGDSGYFEFTRLDTNNVTMSGRFAFNAVSSYGDTVKITQGRFDIKYKN